MKTKLQILEEKIRKDLPRLMELGEGCRVKLADHKKTSDPNNIIKMVNAFTFKSEDIVEIIGHDILLSDVLEWLQLVGDNNIEINYDFLSFSIKRNMFYNGDFGYKYVNWDLSKSCLKYQNEVVIAFLYDLIKNERTI